MIGSIENHRERETGVLVYPVYSRRSEGLSVGINLFPDKKRCSFDCPYCEVFPFETDTLFSLEQMEADLRTGIALAQEQGIPVKDISFSGNGEPTLSPFFPEALQRAEKIRAELCPQAELVLITNGSGLLDRQLFALLQTAASAASPLRIWLKLDAGTPYWYEKINSGAVPFESLIRQIKAFAACAPITIQTMLCSIDGEIPSSGEALAWEQAVLSLAEIADQSGTGSIDRVQIYGKARPAPEDPKALPLPAEYLEERAASLRRTLNSSLISGSSVPQIRVYS